MEVVRKGLEKLPENELLLSTLVEAQIENGDMDEAKSTLSRLKELEPNAPDFDFYEAQFLVREQKWQEAIDRLTKARAKLIYNPQVVAKINTLLGKCYQGARHEDGGRNVSGHHQQNHGSHRCGSWVLAQVLAATGRNAEALQQYESIATKRGVETPDKEIQWRPLLQLRTWAFQLRLPKEQRNWSKVEGLVDQLHQARKLDPIAYVAIQGELLAKVKATTTRHGTSIPPHYMRTSRTKYCGCRA